MSEFVKTEEISRNRVRYTDSSGKNFTYSKGSWAWRNNNPGNIRKPSEENVPAGVIGLAGGFLVFSSYEAGFNALQTLLKKDFYQDLTIFEVVAKYAPTKDKNDVKNYRKILIQVTQLDLNIKLKSLNEAQFLLLCKAIQRVEGFQVGEVIEEVSKKKILDVKKNKDNLIVQYLIEDIGWLPKAKAINLVEKDLVDAVIVNRQSGYVFLRSRPDNTKTNNLGK
jgi:hypothetical protein